MTSGIWYVPFGGSAGVQLAPFPFNPTLPLSARWLRIFNGQLYGSSDYTSPYVYSIGVGLPTSGIQSIADR